MSDTQHTEAIFKFGDGRPVAPSLLRRLAEAADGVTGPAWFVVSYELIRGKHKIYGPFGSEAQAVTHLSSPEQHGVFGPFQAPLTVVHTQTILGWEMHLDDGTSRALTERYDAFFWSHSALRKFVLPYYANVVDPEYAIRIRKAFDKEDVVLMAHDPMTEYKMVGIKRSGQVKLV
jgi:hypothetical protein